MNTRHTFGITGTPAVTMDELRAFVDKTRQVPGGTTVRISSERFNHPTDPGEDRIEVTWQEES